MDERSIASFLSGNSGPAEKKEVLRWKQMPVNRPAFDELERAWKYAFQGEQAFTPDAARGWQILQQRLPLRATWLKRIAAAVLKLFK